MPYRRRRRKNKFEWIAGVLLAFLLLWMAGIRLHLDDALADVLFGKSQRVYWRMELSDGKVYIGKMLYDTPDALTLQTRTENKTAVKPDVVKLEPISSKETKKLRKEGVIEPLGRSPWVTWNKEDMFFSGVRISNSAQSSGNGSLDQALVGQAVKSLPKEGFGGFSKDKITKAFKEGKLQQMDERMVEKYKQQLRQQQKKR